MCGVCRITNLGILLFNFSSKNYRSKVYTYLEKVVVLVTLSTTKLSLLFWIFLRIDIEFTSHWIKPKNWEQSFSTRPPRTFKTFTNRPLAGGGVLAGGEVGHGEANKRQGNAIGLTRD
jgi:hypothetical protein